VRVFSDLRDLDALILVIKIGRRAHVALF
jgi:hypothetical protein